MEWVMVGLMVAGAVFIVVTSRLTSRRRLLQLCLRADLPAEPEVFARLRAHSRARGTAGAIGCLVAAGIASAANVLMPGLGRSDAQHVPSIAFADVQPQLHAALFLACLTCSIAAPALVPLTRVGDTDRHFARLTRLRLSDYLPAWRRWLARATVTTAVVLIILIPAPASAAALHVAGLVAAGASVVVLAVVETVGHRMLSVAQPAASERELITDDAVRAWALCDLWAAPLALATTAIACTLAFTGGEVIAVFIGSGFAVLPSIMIAFSPGSHYRRRLWPHVDEHAPAPVRYPERGWQT